MKFITKVATILILLAITGCGKDDKPAKTTDTAVLKTQRETLEKAKQVDQVLQDAEKQQRQKMDEGAQ